VGPKLHQALAQHTEMAALIFRHLDAGAKAAVRWMVHYMFAGCLGLQVRKEGFRERFSLWANRHITKASDDIPSQVDSMLQTPA